MNQPTMFDPDFRNGRHRNPDWTSSIMGAQNVAYRAGTQKAKLLDAYQQAYPDGLTDEEAAERSGVNMRSCWWRRCTELREDGTIAPVIEAGKEATRAGSSGVQRIVCAYVPPTTD